MRARIFGVRLTTLRVAPVIVIGTAAVACMKLGGSPDGLTAHGQILVGHGALIDHNGQQLTVSPNLIKGVQQSYIQRLEKVVDAVSDSEKERRGSIRKTIYANVSDRSLANALYLDWLIEHGHPQDLVYLTSVNNALRWHYVLNYQRPPRVPNAKHEWLKGLDEETAGRLEKSGLSTKSVTNSGGSAYCDECQAAGVPVPRSMFGPEWRPLGIITNEFIYDNEQAELLLYASDSPPGLCLALPRYLVDGNKVGDEAQVFGVICLGTQSSKVCYFDNPRGQHFRRDVEIDFRSNFVGGIDLVANAQGVCTDCHAGENPFIVHPEKDPFEALDTAVPTRLPNSWPDPLVDASWPQNPGPTSLLDVVSSPRKCIDCHTQGNAGRFPEVSQQLQGYCTVVLDTAAGTTSKRTMPPFGMDRSLFVNHINALQSACSAPATFSGESVVTNVPPDDPAFISAPYIIDPLYQCATRVALRGALLDAKVTLFVNGVPVATVSPARSPSFVEFANLSPLKAGDELVATQSKGAAASGPSPKVVVRDVTADYPNGLPAPTINPTLIHECGDIIAVMHVPGANVTIYTNGGNVVTYGTSTGWTAVWPGKKPFAVGDKFTAKCSFCDVESPLSNPETAVKAPSSIPAPSFDPTSIHVGQELVNIVNVVHQAQGTVSEATAGIIGTFSWPISSLGDFDFATGLGHPYTTTDHISTSQKLCIQGPASAPAPTADCSSLPAPRIRNPKPGDTVVLVSNYVPGARIVVYDSGGVEIGDGSGSVIVLRRALTLADVITVVQRIGECTSQTAYRLVMKSIPRQG